MFWQRRNDVGAGDWKWVDAAEQRPVQFENRCRRKTGFIRNPPEKIGELKQHFAHWKNKWMPPNPAARFGIFSRHLRAIT